MKVYTKKGDTGETSLIGGTRVAKNHGRIDAYGTVDELNSWIGLLRDQEISGSIEKALLEIQDRLFTLGSYLASDPGKSKMQIPTLSDVDVAFLERQMDDMDKALPEMRSFVLPGGHSTVSYCHLARCVCRRAERLVTGLAQDEEVDALAIRYLNRLSDYLFVLARKLSQDLQAQEIPWVPKK